MYMLKHSSIHDASPTTQPLFHPHPLNCHVNTLDYKVFRWNCSFLQNIEIENLAGCDYTHLTIELCLVLKMQKLFAHICTFWILTQWELTSDIILLSKFWENWFFGQNYLTLTSSNCTKMENMTKINIHSSKYRLWTF